MIRIANMRFEKKIKPDLSKTVLTLQKDISKKMTR
jgi:hypothetical protein